MWFIALGVAGALLQGLELVSLRPRPFGVRQLGSWEGYAAPSIPIGALAVLSVGVAYMLIVPGRPRFWAKIVAAVAIATLGLLRIYLGVDGITDVVFGAIVGVSIPLIAFRVFAPNDVVPIAYGAHGKAAHLDVTGRRGDAIRVAIQEQLGATVHEIEPVGLEGSGGSTPLKLTVTDDVGEERTIFAKLYAKSHVRADRWYKLGRMMLYGRLEDETPFGTVRRFVEYEDYTLRMLGEHGFPTPAALGIVEITPEREYLIAMDFFDDAVEIAEVPGLDAVGALLTIAAGHLTVRLTRGLERIEPTHVELARAVSAVARSRGVAVDRGAAQEVQVAISARPDDINVGFWRAVLGYDPLADDNAVDPLGDGSTVWMQSLDPEKPLRHAMHVDVSVAREHAEARVAAALAAGGSLVTDTYAPEAWILADRAGNKVCIAAWPDGAMRPDR